VVCSGKDHCNTVKFTEEVINIREGYLTSRKQPGNDFVKRWVFNRRQNVDNDSAGVTSAGRSFQIRGPTTRKARLATVDNLTGGTTRRLVPEERRARRPGRSVTRWSGPRYCVASPCETLYCQNGDLELNSLRHAQPVETY